MELIWKKPTSAERLIPTRGLLNGIGKSEGWRGTRKMKDTWQISSSQSLTATTPSTSSPYISSLTGCTAWALQGLVSPSTDTSCLPPSTLPLTKMGSTPIGSSIPLAATQPTPPWSITYEHRRTRESQLSSSNIMTPKITSQPLLQNSIAWLPPLKPPSTGGTEPTMPPWLPCL